MYLQLNHKGSVRLQICLSYLQAHYTVQKLPDVFEKKEN